MDARRGRLFAIYYSADRSACFDCCFAAHNVLCPCSERRDEDVFGFGSERRNANVRWWRMIYELQQLNNQYYELDGLVDATTLQNAVPTYINNATGQIQ